MIKILIVGNVSNNLSSNSFMKRPFGIGAFIGIQGCLLNMVGIFFPWDSTLGYRLEWIMGTQLLLGWFSFFISLLAIICFIFRTRSAYRLGSIFGVFALIISGPHFFLFLNNTLYIVGGLYLSFAGSVLITIGGIIGYLRTPKQRTVTQQIE